jgi:hypothetical protein
MALNDQGREYGPSLLFFRTHASIFRRFTATGFGVDGIPHAEAWGYALCSFHERIAT